MKPEQAQAFEQAKARLNAAAARLLAGDRTAIKEADDAMSQTKQLQAEESLSNTGARDDARVSEALFKTFIER